MTTFRTDTDLRAAAFGLAHNMLHMLDQAGVYPTVPGVPGQMDVNVFRQEFEVDAEQYTTMDPGRLSQEYDEIRTAANMNGLESDPHTVVERAKIDLGSNWKGEAAEKFTSQLTKIQARISTQHDYTLVAAQAVGMMYAVNVSYRDSCYDLMEKTSTVCAAIAEKNAPKPADWTNVVAGLVDKLVDVVKSPTEIGGMAIHEILGRVQNATQDQPVAGDEAAAVLDGYVGARDRLFESYEDSLSHVRDWLRERRKEFDALDDTLPEPLPAYADVDSPDFRYEKFFFGDSGPAEYAPEVERERKRYVDQKTKPHGAIARRLAGNG